ncbi:hypothetical protein CKO35_14845 [Ectothiorhodospira shaposhnikovii]|nr:hypothetical protein [Ectothiorhodospira shaposhnikovii]
MDLRPGHFIERVRTREIQGDQYGPPSSGTLQNGITRIAMSPKSDFQEKREQIGQAVVFTTLMRAACGAKVSGTGRMWSPRT